MDKKEVIINRLSLFRNALSKRIKLAKMILFGSYARGDYEKDSDVDLIIVSPNFKKIHSVKRSKGFYILWHYGLNIGYPVDFICYTPEEFERERRRVSLVSMALKEGKEIT